MLGIEWKDRGISVDNCYFYKYNMPFGFFRIAYNEKKILSISTEQDNEKGIGRPSELSDWAYTELMAYLDGRLREFTFPYEYQGTSFQKKVWEALLDIPYGEVRTYGEIAKAIGKEGAYRAVGNANRANPMQIVIPCHRVIKSDGKIGGYGGMAEAGLAMKRSLLELEQRYS